MPAVKPGDSLNAVTLNAKMSELENSLVAGQVSHAAVSEWIDVGGMPSVDVAIDNTYSVYRLLFKSRATSTGGARITLTEGTGQSDYASVSYTGSSVLRFDYGGGLSTLYPKIPGNNAAPVGTYTYVIATLYYSARVVVIETAGADTFETSLKTSPRAGYSLKPGTLQLTSFGVSPIIVGVFAAGSAFKIYGYK